MDTGPFMPSIRRYTSSRRGRSALKGWRLAALIITLVLGGCAAVPPTADTPLAGAELQREAERALDRGEYELAAQRYLELAEQSSDLRRDAWRLEAVSALLRANRVAAAERILAEVDTARLGSTEATRAYTLSARIALAQNRSAEALAALRHEPPVGVAPALRAEIHALRAQAHARSGQPLAAARELILRERWLAAPDEIADNQERIWQTLIVLPDEALKREIDPAPDPFTGWRELALIARAALRGAIDVEDRIDAWRERFPAHPASEEIVGLVIARQRDGVERPMQIAVILPQSGPVAPSGEALRDGFLAAHFARENRAYEPTIRFYDTGADPAAVRAVYARAVEDGADFVVGPLTRSAVSMIAATRPAVPTLTLNYAESGTTSEGLYQFGLAPEDEARQVAHRAWLDGHSRALALVPEGEWGERVLRAFREDWEALGAMLLEAQTYPSDNNDFSEQIKRLLDLDESEQRHVELERVLQQRLAFEPNRRRDVDFIFMAAFPRQARLIRPQLRFHYAGDVPVYSTSHVFSGRIDPAADRDIDGVVFCDMPWVLAGESHALRRDIERLWADAPSGNIRLYALGADAYDIIPVLSTLGLFRYERVDGHTGILQVGNGNRVFRQLQWARFRGGVPRPYE